MVDIIYAKQINDIDSQLMVSPDFDKVRPYLFVNVSDAEYTQFKKDYKSIGAGIVVDFMDIDVATKFVKDFLIVIDKYKLNADVANLGFIFFGKHKETFIASTRYKIPNKDNPKRSSEFVKLINFLLSNQSKNMNLSLVEVLDDNTQLQNKKSKNSKKKATAKAVEPNPYLDNIYIKKASPPSVIKAEKYVCKDEFIVNWLSNTILSAVKLGQFPISMGSQLINSSFNYNARLKHEEFKMNAPEGAFEYSSLETIAADDIATICFPIINYLNKETNFNKGKAKYFSSEQLSFLIELLILAGLHSLKSGKAFNPGKSNPSEADKNYLYVTLDNKGTYIKSSDTLL